MSDRMMSKGLSFCAWLDLCDAPFLLFPFCFLCNEWVPVTMAKSGAESHAKFLFSKKKTDNFDN